MNILAIESSCDETASAVVKDGRFILSNAISSQIDLHAKYGGVVPELASRKHIEVIDQIIDTSLTEAGLTFCDIDCIAVTYGPGLVGALLVGLAEAKALSYSLNKPLVGVHHIQGHIAANYLENHSLQPPFVALVASGGHTHLVHVLDYTQFEVLGRTQDDAAGEAYDKVARVLGLGYPGGPKIDELAKSGNPNAIKFPRAFSEPGNYNFSFSGLKSAVLNYVNSCRMANTDFNPADIAAAFQQAVVDVLVSKTIHAAKAVHADSIVLAGGVASNSALRAAMTAASLEHELCLTIPSHVLCTDNAAMIASAAYYEFLAGRRDGLNLNAIPALAL